VKDLDPNRLLFLLAVVRAGSISGGARTLGWTQQAISGHLRDLEHDIGTPVLLRHNRGVQPTDAGETLLRHAAAIAAELTVAKFEIEELSKLQRGTVRLAAYATAMVSMVPQALAEVGPGVDVRLVTADPEPALDMLRNGEVDLAMVYRFADGPEPRLAGLASVEIGREAVHVIAKADHRAVTGAALRFADLAQESWVVGCEHCQRHLLHAARAAGFTPRIMQQTNDHMAAQALATRGLALSILPRTAFAAFPDARVASRAFPELADRAIIAAYRAGAERVPSIAATLAALTRAAQDEG